MTKNISYLLSQLTSSIPKIKYKAGKDMMSIAFIEPEILYPYFDEFTKYLNSENNIIKWNSIRTLGLLSKADREKKIEKVIPRFFKLLKSSELITINNTILALSDIALNNQQYKLKILNELLIIPKYKFPTQECKNISTGKIVDVLGKFQDYIQDKEKFIKFIKSASKNSRNSTRQKALKLLKKLKIKS